MFNNGGRRDDGRFFYALCVKRENHLQCTFFFANEIEPSAHSPIGVFPPFFLNKEGLYLLRNNAKRRKNAKNVYFNTLIWMMITMSKMCENKLQAIYRCPLNQKVR